MKYISYLVMCLVLLLAAPVVWAGQIGQTVDMPEYSPVAALEFSPIVAADCRDVFVYNNPRTTVYFLRYLKVDEPGIPNGDGNIAWINPGYLNHKGAAVLTDKTVYQCWQSAATYKKDSINQMTSWPITSFN